MTAVSHESPAGLDLTETDLPTRESPSQSPEPATAELAGAIEAVLLAVDKALSASALAKAIVPKGDERFIKRVKDAIVELNAAYEASGRAFRIESVAGGYRLMTLPKFAAAIAAVKGQRESHRLSQAALETLAIVAYRQPITRAHLEAIRGVACGDVLKNLLEKGLVSIAGRAEELGRPMLYGTTKRFLDAFGLASISDLPTINEFLGGAEARE